MNDLTTFGGEAHGTYDYAWRRLRKWDKRPDFVLKLIILFCWLLGSGLIYIFFEPYL
jgi:hypothetical protein